MDPPVEQDDKLREFLKHHKNDPENKDKDPDWKAVAELFGGERTDVQCLHRWQKVLNPSLVKGPWTPEEDAKHGSVQARAHTEGSTVATDASPQP